MFLRNVSLSTYKGYNSCCVPFKNKEKKTFKHMWIITEECVRENNIRHGFDPPRPLCGLQFLHV